MSLFDSDVLHIDRMEPMSRGPLAISDPSGRRIATVEAAGRRTLINWGPRSWRIVQNGQTVLTVRDPRHLGRDKFTLEDASGRRAARIALKVVSDDLLVDLTDGPRLIATGAVCPGSTVFLHLHGREAAHIALPPEEQPAAPQVVRLAAGLPVLLRATTLGTALVTQMLIHKTHLSDLLS